MASKLRADAPVFVPMIQAQAFLPGLGNFEDEMEVSEEDLLELEAADNWVNLMVELDEMEKEHMINLALSYAPAAAQLIEEEAMSRRKASPRKGSRSPGSRK